MRGSASLSNESYSLVLDIYLGGVNGALVKKNHLEHTIHHKTPIPEEDTVITLLKKTNTLLQKTVEDLLSKQKVSTTYIFIDAPFSYLESKDVIFQKDDKTFFTTTAKEIEGGALALPQTYVNLLGDHVRDGVVIEHPPTHHTIHGYTTSNLHLEGERMAQISQQWIQREIYRAIQDLKRIYRLGEITFVTFPRIKKNESVLLLGDVISTLKLRGSDIIIGAGTRISIAASAQKNRQDPSFIESVIKGVAQHHGLKDQLYMDVVHEFEKSFSKALRQNLEPHDTKTHCTYVGDTFMFPVIKDSVSSKNVDFTEKNTSLKTRLSYIIENKVQ